MEEEGFSCLRRGQVKMEAEGEGGEVEEEDSCTLVVWEVKVVWEKREPPWQETPIQYSSLEATVEKFVSKEKLAKQRESLSGKEIVQRKLTGKEGEILTRRRRS